MEVVAGQDVVQGDVTHCEEQPRLHRVEIEAKGLPMHKVNESIEVLVHSEAKVARFRALSPRLDQYWHDRALLWRQRVQEEAL